MKLKSIFLLFAIMFLSYHCKNNVKPSDTKATTSTKSELKDISELTYIEIYYTLFSNNNGGLDFHGDGYGQDAVSNVELTEEKSACGNEFFLTNTSQKKIDLAIKSSFSFPGNPTKEIIRAYKIKPAEKISIGNSKLCYNGKEFMIQKDIISAGFSTNLEK